MSETNKPLIELEFREIRIKKIGNASYLLIPKPIALILEELLKEGKLKFVVRIEGWLS